jgi:hypothetical protein
MDRPFPWLGSKISGNGISLPAVFHLEPICGNSNSSLEILRADLELSAGKRWRGKLQLGLDVRDQRSPIVSRNRLVNPGLQVSRFFDQRGCHAGVGGGSSEVQKCFRLLRKILPANPHDSHHQLLAPPRRRQHSVPGENVDNATRLAARRV